MKRMFGLLLLTLALPVAGFATSIDFTNSAGTLSGSNAGLSLSGSTLIAINGPGGLLTGNLGSLTFSTGALASGSLQMGGAFAAGGSLRLPAMAQAEFQMVSFSTAVSRGR